ncbi:MAG: hypothetical protein AAGF24_13750, partial [Cyanobacteria bacterium P01_H01_bin.121]
ETVEQETILVNGRVVRQPPSQLKTSFVLEALLPTSDVDELPEIQPPPAAVAPGEAGAPAETPQ